MKKRYLFLFSLINIFLPFTVNSKTLTPEEALLRVENSTKGKIYFPSMIQAKLVYTVRDNSENATLYVFDKEDNKGFMILSAEDEVTPLLGYSDSGNFQSDNLPPNLKYWLENYNSQIEYLRKEGTDKKTNKAASLPSMSVVEPLIKTKWNQGAPYNKYCYEMLSDGDSTQSVTGCVATAMAQVMNYFQYPTIGEGEISYKHGDSGEYSMNFSTTPFDWTNMQDTYYPESYTTQSAEAVAFLMKSCGYSVKMNYGAGESGASGGAIPGALINYFKYGNGIKLQERKFWSYNDWAEMLHKNLSEVGPIIYDGSALDGGHSFICDGYDGNGYFHFNWGWGGMADGYYLLDALNPDEYGIGGAAGGYNLGQVAILGISPKDINIFTNQLMQLGSLSGEIEDNNLILKLTGNNTGYENLNPITNEVYFGLVVINQTDTTQKEQVLNLTDKAIECKQNDIIRINQINKTINLDNLNLTIGDKYNLIISSNSDSSDESSWIPIKCMPGYSNFVTIQKTENGYEIINDSIGTIEVSNYKIITSPVYENLPIEFYAEFKNTSGDQLTRNFSAEFYNEAGSLCFKTENFSITVNGNDSISQNWTSVQWYNENKEEKIDTATTFNLKLYDNWEGKYVDGIDIPVTILPEPTDSKVEANLSISDATLQDEVYIIKGTQFNVSITIKVEKGFFSKPINIDIESPTSDGGYYSVQSKRFATIPTLSEGEGQILTMSMDFNDAQPDKEYWIQAWSGGQELGKRLNVMFDLTNTGINSITSNKQKKIRIFNLNGIEVLETKDANDITNLSHGIYIIDGKKVMI